MNIAVVGGGYRCKSLMEIIERHTFQDITPKIVAVSDLKPDAVGFVKAVDAGLFTTSDYNDFFDRDDIELIIELTGSMDIYNDILKKKKGSVRAISARTARLFWEIYRVSTMQKKTDQELHEARAMYRVLINELIQEDVIVIAHDFRIVDINETLLKKLKLSREEVIGRRCHEITHHRGVPCSGERHPCPLVQTLETEQPSQTTHVHLDKDGRELYYSISTYPLLEDDDVIGAIEISRDITRDINVQKVMMQQEKLASIGRLSAGVAHEINNPLTTILTSAMLLQEDADPDSPLCKELETIANETLRCREIVTSLLDFARQTKPVKNMFDINDIVISCVLLTKKQAAFKDIRVSQILHDGALPIFVDRGQLEQVMINLILNAVEATGGGGEITVTTSSTADEDFVEISIGDTGPGIPEADIGRIFDPFFTTKSHGTGLGLAITHGIIEQHGGTISVQSKTGQGTRFTILLPMTEGP